MNYELHFCFLLFALKNYTLPAVRGTLHAINDYTFSRVNSQPAFVKKLCLPCFVF